MVPEAPKPEPFARHTMTALIYGAHYIHVHVHMSSSLSIHVLMQMSKSHVKLHDIQSLSPFFAPHLDSRSPRITTVYMKVKIKYSTCSLKKIHPFPLRLALPHRPSAQREAGRAGVECKCVFNLPSSPPPFFIPKLYHSYSFFPYYTPA